jgi:exosortase
VSVAITSASSFRIFGALWIVSLLIWWQAIAATVALALRQDAYTHIILILPISITLIRLEWKRLKVKPSPGIRSGIALLALAVLIGVAGLRWGRLDIFTGDVRLALEMLAVVTWWLGSFVGCFGGSIFRACMFPLLFLLWLVPLPEFAVDHIVSFLQQGTASCARMMLVTAGVPVAQTGTTLMVPGLTLEIAQECSSIRSSLVLVVTSMVMSYLLLRSFWGRTVVILASLPLALAKNGLRVFTLAVLGAYVDPGVLNSQLHHQGGVLFLAIALAVMFLLIRSVSWIERRTIHPLPGKQITQLSPSGTLN